MPLRRWTRNEVIDQSADASRPVADRKPCTKPSGNGGEKSTVAERAKNIIQARKGEGIRYEET